MDISFMLSPVLDGDNRNINFIYKDNYFISNEEEIKKETNLSKQLDWFSDSSALSKIGNNQLFSHDRKIKANIYNAYILFKEYSKYKFDGGAKDKIQCLFRDYYNEVIGFNDIYPLKNPPLFKGELKEHQKAKIPFILNRKKLIIAWDMGLGKTVTAIYAALSWKNRGEVNKCLIVCPASLRNTTWKKELSIFTNAKFSIASGTLEERIKAYNSDSFFVVCSYDAVRMDYRIIKGFDCFIIDESSSIKNIESQNFKSLYQLKPNPEYALLLNGTPIENTLKEMYNQLQWIYPNELKDSLVNLIEDDKVREECYALFLSKYIVSYKKEEITGIKKSSLNIRREWLELNSKQRKKYNEIKEKIKGTNKEAIFGNLTRLQQICNDLSLIGINDDNSPKIKRLKEIHYLSIKKKDKCIYFTQYKTLAEKIAKELKGCILYTGGLSDKEREKAISEYKTNPEITALIMTTAGAKGLNLPETKRVVLFDSLFNPAVMEQIICRADRPVSDFNHEIEVIYLLTLDTIEENKQKILDKKRGDSLKVFNSIQEFHKHFYIVKELI